MSKGLNVHSEIGKLKKVVLHRPGRDLVNVKAEEFEDVWIHDCFYLDVAQKEHDAFADLLRSEGVEVLYMEKLVAEALDACPSARAEFTDTFMAESGIVNPMLEQAVREKLDAISDSYQFVLEAMGGYRYRDLELPRVSTTLSMMDNEDAKPDDLVLKPLPSSYFSRDPLASVGKGVLLHHMYWKQRDREVPFYEAIFKYHPDYVGTPIWYDHKNPWHIEGGDVLNINAHTLAIGISQRTEAAAIEELAKNLFWGSGNSEIDTVYAIKIPNGYAYMHLDTVCTMVDFDKFTVYPGIFETLRVYRLVVTLREWSLFKRLMTRLNIFLKWLLAWRRCSLLSAVPAIWLRRLASSGTTDRTLLPLLLVKSVFTSAMLSQMMSSTRTVWNFWSFPPRNCPAVVAARAA